MAFSQKHDFTGLTVYSLGVEARTGFPSPAAGNARCLGVFYLSGGLKLTGPDGGIPCGAVDIFTRWTAYGVDINCEVGLDGAEWFCFLCDNPQSKTTEQVSVNGSYTLPAQTQAIVVKGALTAAGQSYAPVSEMLFANATPISGTGTLILVR
jgi:hypothetical protein